MRRLVLPEKKGYSGEVGLGLRGEGGRRHPYIDACRRRGGLDLLWGGGGGHPFFTSLPLVLLASFSFSVFVWVSPFFFVLIGVFFWGGFVMCVFWAFLFG